MDEEDVTVENLTAIFDTDFMGLVSCVVAVWFGNRTFGKWKTSTSYSKNSIKEKIIPSHQ